MMQLPQDFEAENFYDYSFQASPPRPSTSGMTQLRAHPYRDRSAKLTPPCLSISENPSSLASMLLLKTFKGQNTHPTNESSAVSCIVDIFVVALGLIILFLNVTRICLDQPSQPARRFVTNASSPEQLSPTSEQYVINLSDLAFAFLEWESRFETHSLSILSGCFVVIQNMLLQSLALQRQQMAAGYPPPLSPDSHHSSSHLSDDDELDNL